MVLVNAWKDYVNRLNKSYCDVRSRLFSTPQPLDPTCPEQSVPVGQEKWYYPAAIAHDLDNIKLPQSSKEEIYACAWEYARCVIPQYTNWDRYVAVLRVIIIAIVAEYKGDMIQVAVTDNLLGYNLSNLLTQIFDGSPSHAELARELRCCLLISGDKSSSRRGGLLFQRYVPALAKSPRQWFRMRDTDGLLRFTIGAALACNDINDFWYTEEQLEMLNEIGSTLYDSVAFFKHRAEGETNSTFAYVPPSVRVKAFRQCRELLWALDVAWAGRPEHLVIINFLRFFGGPTHMMMRRYRFVEDGMVLGCPETPTAGKEACQNVKLWNRVDPHQSNTEDVERYESVLSRRDELMFDGLPEMLESSLEITCQECQNNQSRKDPSYAFGGVHLCTKCQNEWAQYMDTLPNRFANVFPEVKSILSSQGHVFTS